MSLIFKLIMTVLILMIFIFSASFITTFMSLNNEPWVIRPALIDLNSFEFIYYPLMISLDECNGSCNVVDDSSPKICLLSKTKDLNVEVFNMVTTVYEANTLVKHFM